jgi:glycosyltransferase involved in cell wall biosynthesis
MCKNPKTVIFSPIIPFRGYSHGLWFAFSSLLEPTVSFLKSDLVLTQSAEAEATYRRLGCNVMPFVYSGVDLNRFHPISSAEKKELRAKYDVESDKFVILHVGSVRKWRNVECLKKIQDDDENQVFLVGRPATKYERDVTELLEKSGVTITHAYNPKIEEFYALSDCYIFPTMDPAGSIDVPLSVLEAMASGLPVILTGFGGLPQIFEGGRGVYFAKIEEFADTLKVLKANGTTTRTRELVSPYSWENIARGLLRVYEQMLQ